MPDDLTAPYKPVALILEDSDTMEYVNKDCASYSLRIDDNLSGIYDMKTRQLIGFRLENWSRICVDSAE
jgi:hypothetical protein